jgi:hypothetical protein
MQSAHQQSRDPGLVADLFRSLQALAETTAHPAQKFNSVFAVSIYISILSGTKSFSRSPLSLVGMLDPSVTLAQWWWWGPYRIIWHLT